MSKTYLTHVHVDDCPICVPPLRDREGRARAEQLELPCLTCGLRLGAHAASHPHACMVRCAACKATPCAQECGAADYQPVSVYVPQSAFQALAVRS